MFNREAMFSSGKTDWRTPDDVFNTLDAEFHFTLDPCPGAHPKCAYYLPEEGLDRPWAPHVAFVNPPYGRQVGKWIAKGRKESDEGATVVMLLPSRTDTRWWHDIILDAWKHGKAEIRFLRGRLKFGGAENSAPFPSCIVVFRPLSGEYSLHIANYAKYSLSL